MEEDNEILRKLLTESNKKHLKKHGGLIILLPHLQALEHTLNRLEQDEKVIEEMAKVWKQDDIRSIEEIIDHFRKKCE